MPPVLSYSRPLARDPGPADPDLLRAAMYCALVPLCLGVADFLAWLPTHWIPLAFAGFWVILLGLVMFVIGGICLLAYLVAELLAGREPVRTVIGRVGAVAFLLLINFPIAWAIILAVRAIDPRFFD
jgi:hypothetical protein